MNFYFLAILLFFVGLEVNKASGGRLEGKTHSGLKHYGTDLNELMKGMVEVSKGNGKRVFFKSELTKSGSLETRVILPDTEYGVPQGLAQVGPSQFEEGPEQSERQTLPQQMSAEEEVVLPDKQFTQ